MPQRSRVAVGSWCAEAAMCPSIALCHLLGLGQRVNWCLVGRRVEVLLERLLVEDAHLR